MAGEEDESEPNVILLDPLEFRRSCIACIIGEWCDSVGLTLRPAEGFDEICNSGSMPHCRLFALSVGGSSVAADPVRADIEKARMLFPDAPLVIMSDLDSQDEVRAAYYCGARGFVPTSLDLDVTLRALRFILGGGSYFPPSALSPASLRVGIDTSRAGADSPTVGPSPDPPGVTAEQTIRVPNILTDRQQQVAALLTEGLSNKLIARKLGMTEATVKVHVRQIMRKLGVRNRTQIALALTAFPGAGGGCPDQSSGIE